MAYLLTWLLEVLEPAGLKVAEQSGWRTRGHGDVGTIRGVICHHTAGPLTGNMPSLGIVTNGRPDLSGPLAQLGLGRDGTFYVVAAGLAYHAGKGSWQGITTGNTSFIGIEAENTGERQGPKADTWPEVQLDAYRRGVAAILEKIGVDPIMCCGHKEYALPPGRKTDPDFDMNAFRQQVRAIISGTVPRATLIPAVDTATNRPTLRRGATGPAVQEVQTKLGLTADGSFGPGTEAAVRQFQRSHGLIPDGIVGPQTWAAISGSGTRATGSTPVVPPIGVVAPMPIPPPDDPAHPVTVQGNKVIGPDGKSFAIVFKSGFVTSGKTSLADWLKAAPRPSDITKSMVRVVRAVSLNEGKLEAINSL